MIARRVLLVCSALGLLLITTSCDDDNGTTPNLHEPAAAFTAVPSSGTTLTTFQLDASGSADVEDPSANLEVRWDWENDGTWDTPYTTTKTAGHQYETTGTKTIMLEVKDTGGLTDKEAHSVEVSAANLHAPVAAFTVAPSSGTTRTTFQMDATGSTDVEDPSAALEVRWDWENDGTWDTEYSTVKTASHQYETEGTKTILLEARDTGGLADSATSSVAVITCSSDPQLNEGFENPASFETIWQVVDGTVAVESGGFGSGNYWAHGHATGENDAAMVLKDLCSLDWSNYTLECDVQFSSNDAWSYAMIYFYVQSPEGWSFGPRNGYEIVLKAFYDVVQLNRWTNGRAAAELGIANYVIDTQTTYHVKVVLQNPTFRIYVNGSLVIEAQDSEYMHGTIALSGGTGGGSWTFIDTYYDNVTVTPTSTKAEH